MLSSIRIYLAVTGNSPTLEKSLEQITKIQEAWDETWERTFTGGFVGGSSPYFMIVYIATFIALLASLWWLMRWAKDLSAGDFWGKHLPQMVMVLVVAYFLTNNGQQLAALLKGLHLLGRSWETGILKAEINGVKIAEVLNDQLATSQAKDAIEQAFKHCDALPAPAVALPSVTRPTDVDLTPAQRQVYDKLECYENAASTAEEIKDQYSQNYCWGACTGLARFFKNVQQASSEWIEGLKTKISKGEIPNFGDVALTPLGNVLLTSTLNQILKWLLYAIQKAFYHIMEFGQWGAALSAPTVLALAVVPTKQSNAIANWLIIFFNIWMVKIYYALILGAYASVIALAGNQTSEDLTFAFVLGLFAPLVAASLAVGGAMVMLRSVAGAGANLATTAISIGASTAISYISIARSFLSRK